MILRAGTVYGGNPVARFDTFVNCFVLDAALGRPLHVHGSGEQARPVVHVDSLGEAVAKSVVRDMDPGTYNVVDANVTVNDTVEVLREASSTVEAIHTNQQARLHDLRVRPTVEDCLLPSVPRTLREDLPRMLEAIRLA